MTAPRAGDPVPEPTRPPRPVLVELASALLVVTGVFTLILALAAPPVSDPALVQTTDAVALLAVLLGLVGIVLGILTRTGRAWLVTINVVAVEGFLELTSGAASGVLFGALDVFVLVVLLVNRPWFQWRADDEAASRPGGRAS